MGRVPFWDDGVLTVLTPLARNGGIYSVAPEAYFLQRYARKSINYLETIMKKVSDFSDIRTRPTGIA